MQRKSIVVLAFLLTAASVVATEALPIEAQTPPAVDVTFELDAVTGFTYVDASERIVVVGGNEVLIFDRDGALLHRVTGIEGALGAEEWRTSVVVIAHETNELVLIDTTTGAITRRVRAGAVNVTSVAVAGDWAWFTHGFHIDTGISRLFLSSGVVEPNVLGRNNVQEYSYIEASHGAPGTVFAANMNLTRFEVGTMLWSREGGPYEAVLASEAGDRLWVFDGQLAEMSTTTLGKTGFVYDYDYAVGGVSHERLAAYDDRLLAVASGPELTMFRVGQPEPLHWFRLMGRIDAVDLSGQQLFVLEGRTTADGQPTSEKHLRITPHDFVPAPNTIGVAIEAHGTPGEARPSLTYHCSDGSSGWSGALPRMPYGYWVDLEVSLAATSCIVRLSDIADRHRTYLWAPDGELVESTWARIEITGNANRDVAVFFQVLPSPINDATEFVKQQYHDLLQRYPDPAGVSYWVNLLNRGATTDYQLVQKFVESPEFLGSMAPAMRLYLAYFLRWPDEAGLAFWANAIRGGMSVGQISDFFATSPEFTQRYGSLSNRDFVALVYSNVLGRSPDAVGYRYWLDRMDRGMSRGAVMTSFSESPEFIGQTGAQVTVRSLYRGLLRREPDDGGFAYWSHQYQQTQSLAPLIVGFLDSEEYFDRFWFLDDEGLPPTRVGAFEREGRAAIGLTPCSIRCHGDSQVIGQDSMVLPSAAE